MELHDLHLQPFDHLIYTGYSLVDLAIQFKTWSRASHIEVYEGGGFSLASRNGKGVDRYPFRSKGLAYVLRPNQPFQFEKGKHWFECKARGLKYPWIKLLDFYLPFDRVLGKGMICSSFGAYLDAMSNFRSFNPDWNFDKLSPADFLKSPSFDCVYHLRKITRNS